MPGWFRRRNGPRLSVNKARTKFEDFPYFFSRFLREAERQGWKFESNLKKKTDLVLVFRGARTSLDKIKARQAEGAKVVQRVDGIWGWREGRIVEHEKTRTLLEVFEFADAVVYQSRFNKEVFKELLPPPKPGCKEYIIYNGADPAVFSREGPVNRVGDFDKLLVASAWHMKEWKGLENVIEVFKALERKDCGLAVIGEAAENVDHPNIIYLGRLKQDKMASVFRGADALLYFPWFDWCPNNVVEAILCGLPVITSSQGGQTELIGPSGIIVPSRPERSVKEFYRPAAVDLAWAIKAINQVLDDPAAFKFQRDDLLIENCVKNYLNAFEEILGRSL